MTIHGGFSHEKQQCSTAMLNCQRVSRPVSSNQNHIESYGIIRASFLVIFGQRRVHFVTALDPFWCTEVGLWQLRQLQWQLWREKGGLKDILITDVGRIPSANSSWNLEGFTEYPQQQHEYPLMSYYTQSDFLETLNVQWKHGPPIPRVTLPEVLYQVQE